MRLDGKSFSVFLVKLAIKGALKIKKKGEKFFLEKTGEEEKLNSIERKVLWDLSKDSKEIEVCQDNYLNFQKSKKALEKTVKDKFKNLYFSLNTGKTLIGLIFSILVGFFFWHQFVNYKIFSLFFYLL